MKLTNNHIRNLSGIGMAVCLILWTSNEAQAQVPALYRDTNQRGTVEAKAKDPAVVRSKNIIVDVRQLRNKQRRSISMPVFGGKSVVLSRSTWDEQKGRLIWKGKIANQPGSSVTFVVVGDVVVGDIFTGTGRMFQVRYLGNGVHSLRELDQSKFPNEGESREPPRTVQGGKPGELQAIAGPPTCTTDPATEIDVLVVFTATTRAVAGGTAAVQAEILLAVEETNDSYANSQITQRLRLAHMEEVNYAESGSSTTDKLRLQNPNDGILDNVHALRDTFAADVVVLLVEKLDNCGEAFIMNPVSNAFEKFAFCVVQRTDCATGNFSFGHELGHIMGARHDWDADDTNNSPFAFNHGFINTTPTSPARRFRTIMAVNGTPLSHRIQFWSNPDINNPVGGDPTGVSTGSRQANNARTLNSTALTVANFRCGLTDKNKIWTTVGSDGKIDEKDVGKVFFDRSIAQMGRLLSGSTTKAQRRALFPQQTEAAVIRYNVTPTDTLFRVSGGIELRLNYLAAGGSAKVIANLIEVDLASGTETIRATFNSTAFPASNNYQVRSVDQCGPGIDVPFDFERNAYYVEVTLTTRAIAVGSAAGVSMIKISKTDCQP